MSKFTTEEARKVFSAMGKRGGKAQKRKVTRKDLARWGKAGGKAGGRGRKKHDRPQPGKVVNGR